ncbi:hypothetical protein [Salipiger abyssi]|uniref:hypothetical protein n=1 Tax=Salipiger abyssi TaxID=1250539 RepID=UPI002E2CEE68|nr:hypothetical protein [Salipiger abyssi]
MSRAVPPAFRRALIACAAVLALPSLLAAQDAAPTGLSLELNAQEQVEKGCKLSFLARNGFDGDIAKAVFETVLFDGDGQVERLTLFDFGTLPAGKPRLRQFVVPGLQCDALGQILINGASTCEAGTLGAGACGEGLTLTSRTDVEMMG